MWIDFQPLPGAVAFQTGPAIEMAGLTRLKVPQRLSPMLRGPDPLGHGPPGMACLALGAVKLGMPGACRTHLDV